jgi:hypothetical protein
VVTVTASAMNVMIKYYTKEVDKGNGGKASRFLILGIIQESGQLHALIASPIAK